jgi:hypothetical protein
MKGLSKFAALHPQPINEARELVALAIIHSPTAAISNR